MPDRIRLRCSTDAAGDVSGLGLTACMDDEALQQEATIVALVREGLVLDPLGRTADELADAHRRHRLEAKGIERMRIPFQALGKPMFGPVTSWPALSQIALPPEIERVHEDDAFVGALRALELRQQRLAGERRALLAKTAGRMRDERGDWDVNVKDVASSAACELRLPTTALEREMWDAFELVRALPAAHEAAAEGRISAAHLRVIDRETRPIREDAAFDPAERARVVEALVDIAERVTPGVLRRRAKRIVDAALTTPLQDRHEAARQRRRIDLFDVADGMSDLLVRLPSVEAHAIMDRAREAAKRRPKDDPRTLEQFMVDTVIELLLDGVTRDDHHGVNAIVGQVMLTMPAAMLIDETDVDRDGGFGAELDGRTLIDPASARRLARGSSMWMRLFTDPVTGVAVTVDTYRPRASQRRFLAGRDDGCVFPGCDRPVLRADVDHTLDWAKGGTTSLDNLGNLCRRDHVTKHVTRWRARQLSRGRFEWTSPTGTVMMTGLRQVGPRFIDGPPGTAPPGERAPAPPPKLGPLPF